MKFILAKKLGMSRLFSPDGRPISVTIVVSPPNFVVRTKSSERDGYEAVQLGFGETSEKRLKKPERGHLEGLPALKHLREFKTEDAARLKRGEKIGVQIFEPGELVKVSGRSIGRGFQGVVKRHGFAGGPKSHGHRHVLRAPGAIGGRFPQRVRKGKRMAGRMGGGRVSVRNIEIVRVDGDANVLYLRGAVPGKRGTILELSGQ